MERASAHSIHRQRKSRRQVLGLSAMLAVRVLGLRAYVDVQYQEHRSRNFVLGSSFFRTRSNSHGLRPETQVRRSQNVTSSRREQSVAAAAG